MSGESALGRPAEPERLPCPSAASSGDVSSSGNRMAYIWRATRSRSRPSTTSLAWASSCARAVASERRERSSALLPRRPRRPSTRSASSTIACCDRGARPEQKRPERAAGWITPRCQSPIAFASRWIEHRRDRKEIRSGARTSAGRSGGRAPGMLTEPASSRQSRRQPIAAIVISPQPYPWHARCRCRAPRRTARGPSR